MHLQNSCCFLAVPSCPWQLHPPIPELWELLPPNPRWVLAVLGLWLLPGEICQPHHTGRAEGAAPASSWKVFSACKSSQPGQGTPEGFVDFFVAVTVGNSLAQPLFAPSGNSLAGEGGFGRHQT